MSDAVAAGVIQYSDADTGEPFEITTWIDQMRPGEIFTKRVNITNMHSLNPIRLINPITSGLQIIQYPTDLDNDMDVIPPGESRVLELEVDVPQEQSTPPFANWEFDVAVISWR